jgi:acetyl-CoA carboxylase biotin carboxyl carrier protein
MRAGRRGRDTHDPVEMTRRLAALCVDLNLSEIEVVAGDVRVRVSRGGPAPAVAAAPTAAGAPAGATTPAAADATSSSFVTIEAPMVGTFYRSSAPGSDPYVREGDTVKQGQILCIIEAMKLMNEIESKVSGRIAKVLVDNAQAVEFGQPLFLLDPLR